VATSFLDILVWNTARQLDSLHLSRAVIVTHRAGGKGAKDSAEITIRTSDDKLCPPKSISVFEPERSLLKLKQSPES